MDKNVLEQLLSSYNWWMGVSTILVAIGILGEYVAHFVFEREARTNRLEMSVTILFGVLVLGGVVGEYIFGERLSQVSKQLQQVADSEVAQANKDAAQARKDTEFASKQAGEANDRASANEKEAASLQKKAADLNKKAEELRGQNLQTEQRLQAERATRLELEATLAPRTIAITNLVLGAEFRGDFQAVKKFKGTCFVIETVFEPEARKAGGQVERLLTIADWSKVSSHASLDLDTPDGVEIAYHFIPKSLLPEGEKADRSEYAAEILREYLVDNGWTAVKTKGVFDGMVPGAEQIAPNTVRVRVGLKPETYFFPEQHRKLLDAIERNTDKVLRESPDFHEPEKKP